LRYCAWRILWSKHRIFHIIISFHKTWSISISLVISNKILRISSFFTSSLVIFAHRYIWILCSAREIRGFLLVIISTTIKSFLLLIIFHSQKTHLLFFVYYICLEAWNGRHYIIRCQVWLLDIFELVCASFISCAAWIWMQGVLWNTWGTGMLLLRTAFLKSFLFGLG
jgi:hypothetical protein